MHMEVVRSAYDVINRKGYSNWAGGLATTYIANAVLDDTKQIMPLSTCIRGMYVDDGDKVRNDDDDAITNEKDIFLSMPCVVGANGIERIIQLPLTESEQRNLRTSANTLWNVQKDIWENII